ncbi:hypothetical protein [Glycomyces buryatensis]|uniref:Uncharacterized protein n=1 Tax=Glycomyces buryatensis TaxID=2570927 RepID=A0A4S8QK94_9ACTN|nr:hypothetical protein [Glycomyces buryatensis]THV41849.1 hypothetical protein FAB82_09000 [Glycomyces buryatensis]
MTSESSSDAVNEPTANDRTARAHLLKEDAEYDHGLSDRELIKQENLIYTGLIGFGILMVQPFLTETDIGTAGMVCIVSFAIGIPLLTGLVVLNWHESFRSSTSKARIVLGVKSIGQGASIVGAVAAFWNMSWIAGVAFLSAAVLALFAHSAGYFHVEKQTGNAPESWSGSASPDSSD